MKLAVPFLILSLACALPVYAGSLKGELNSIPAPGVAMVGAPKMPAGFAHLAYADPDAPQGGTLRLSATGSFDTLNPFSLKGKAAQGLNLAYDKLMGRSWDEPFTLYPLIAARAEIPDDRSSLTVYIDPRARFQDGSPITADDVIFSFTTLKDKGRPNMRQVYKLVARVDRIGGNGVKFTLGPAHDRETVMILAMMPVLSKAYWTGREFDKTTLKIPVTSGPYKILSVDPGRRIVYARDRSYWANDLGINKGLYNFDRVSYDYFRDETIAFEAFKSGIVDIRIEKDPGRWTVGYDLPAVRSGAIRQAAIPYGRTELWWGFIFNTRHNPFDDLRVREALSLMIDYDWINKNIFHGLYRPTASFFPNSVLAATGSPGPEELKILEPFRAELPPEVFGPAWSPSASGSAAANRADQLQADRLLKAAGFIVRDGKRVNAATGKPLSFEILIQTKDDEKVGLAFRRSLAKLGIEVGLRNLDEAAFHDRLSGFDYDMIVYTWANSLSPGSEQMIYWGCEAARQEGRPNYSGICSPATDSLAKGIPSVTSQDELIARVRALDRVLTWSHIGIPLFYNGKDMIASGAAFHHPQTPALYGNVMENWWFQPSGSAPPSGPSKKAGKAN